MNCCHLKCAECGPSKKLNLEDPTFLNNQDEIPIWVYAESDRAGNTTQLELIKKELEVSEIFTQHFIPQLLAYLPHYFSIRFLHRFFSIRVQSLKRNELIKAMDFSTAVPLEASKLLCGSTRRYAALAIYYAFSNPRSVVLSNGKTVKIHDTEVFYALCETIEKGKKMTGFFMWQ